MLFKWVFLIQFKEEIAQVVVSLVAENVEVGFEVQDVSDFADAEGLIEVDRCACGQIDVQRIVFSSDNADGLVVIENEELGLFRKVFKIKELGLCPFDEVVFHN